AAGAFGQRNAAPFFRFQSRFAHFINRQLLLLFAVGADNANQPLREDAIQSGHKVVRLDAHVDKASDDVRHVVRVDGGEHQVTRQGRLNGYLGRLLVADFADHDFVRVVAQNRTQTTSEGEPLLLVYGDLRNSTELVFDRVFNR